MLPFSLYHATSFRYLWAFLDSTSQRSSWDQCRTSNRPFHPPYNVRFMNKYLLHNFLWYIEEIKYKYLYVLSLSRGGGGSHWRYVSLIAVGIVSLETTCWSNTTELLNAFLMWISCKETEKSRTPCRQRKYPIDINK